jgi:hypothetical protein
MLVRVNASPKICSSSAAFFASICSEIGTSSARTAWREAAKHQEFVGAGYFDDVTQVAMEGLSSTLAMEGSTEREQF